jgi:hypothetical protein
VPVLNCIAVWGMGGLLRMSASWRPIFSRLRRASPGVILDNVKRLRASRDNGPTCIHGVGFELNRLAPRIVTYGWF